MKRPTTKLVFGVCLVLAIVSFGCQRHSDDVGNQSSASPDVASAQRTSTETDIEVDEDLDSRHESAREEQVTTKVARGSGRRGPGGPGMGRGAMAGMRGDTTTLHAMFADRDKITRTINNLPNGAEAITESDDQAIASLIQEHVPAMEGRVVGNDPLPPMTFHPIFVELIKRSDAYTLEYEETEKGIKVRYASDDPFVVMLVQEHARLVSRFIKNGMAEIHKPYTLPTLEDASGEESAAIEPSGSKSESESKSE